jgi:Protein of unknown function (DUF3147)
MGTPADQILLRWIIGGAVVSAFALAGSLLKPKSFAGLFGGAPSVALATLILALSTKGRIYSANEARSMAGGAVAFVMYATCVKWLILRYKLSALRASSLVIIVWLIVAFAVWEVVLR